MAQMAAFGAWFAPWPTCVDLFRMYGSAAFLEHVRRTLSNRRWPARFISLMCRHHSDAHRYG